MGRVYFVTFLILLFSGPTAFNSEKQEHRWVHRNWALKSNLTFDNQSVVNPIKVAVVDTGVDAGHSELSKLVDSRSKSFVSVDLNPTDFHGHGTHVAGIIAAVANWNVSILSAKFYFAYSSGRQNLLNSIEALKFAVNSNVKIINYSAGGPEFSQAEFEVLKLAERKGILIITAAGNDGVNADLKKNLYYPCAYNLTNVICVTGVDQHNKILKSSNWGKKRVHLAAPANEILSLSLDNMYAFLTGTSQATAFVSGAAARVWSTNENLTASQVKGILLKSVTKVPSLKNKCVSQGMLNINQAVLEAKNTLFTRNDK